MPESEIQSLLGNLRQRVRRYVVVDSVLAILAVILIAFWVGLLVDYVPVTLGGSEMPRSARAVLLFAVGFVVLFIVGRMLIARLQRPLPDDSLALLVERHHPELNGRLVTAVQLSQPNRSGDSHSPDLLRVVHRQASESMDRVDPGRVFRNEPLVRKAAVAVPLLLMVLGFAIYSPSAFGRAAARLTLFSDDRWPRRADLEMVGVDLPLVTASSSEEIEPARVEFADKVLQLPIGSSASLRVRAVADTAEVPSVCTVYYETDDGTRGQSNMRRVGRERDGYQAFVLDGPPLSNLGESFTFSVQGLDDRLTDYRVEAVDPPTLAKMNVNVRYPDYLRADDAPADGFDLETEYQAGLRISEGSDIILEAVSSLPLGNVDAVIEYAGQEQPLTDLSFSDDRMSVQMRLNQFRNPTAIRLVPANQVGISAQAPFRYFLGAVLDEPPSVSISLSGIQSAVTPIALLPVSVKVKDDYGVKSTDVFVARSNQASDATGNETQNDPSKDDQDAPIQIGLQPDRDGVATTAIDLRELTNQGTLPALQPGSAISVYAEVADGFNLDSKHLTTSEIFRLQVVTPEELLTLLERRELGLRTRLEQTVNETQGLRDQLVRFRVEGFEVGSPDDPSATTEDIEQSRLRELQIIRLRVQQSGLQAAKTAEELTGIAESLDDILQEMVNNRVDSKDRQERLGSGVRDPLRQIADVSMEQLKDQIKLVEQAVQQAQLADERNEDAIKMVDQVLLDLTAVLEKMLDLESYNELLDLVRGLIQDQESLKKETQEERKRRVRSLFD